MNIRKRLKEEWQPVLYWELPVFVVAFVCNCILMVIALFFNKIPGVEDDYKKLSEDEKQDIALRKQQQQGFQGKDKYGSIVLDEFQRPPNPELTSNPFSRAIYSWLDPILEIGFRRVLEDYDLYELNHTDQARTIMSAFAKYWSKQLEKAKSVFPLFYFNIYLFIIYFYFINNYYHYCYYYYYLEERELTKKRRPSVLKALVFSFGPRFMVAGVLKLFNDLLTFVGPYCLNRIVLYIQQSDPLVTPPGTELMPTWEAYTWVAVMAISAVCLSIISQYYFFIGFRVGMKVRAALVTAVYEKSFKLSSASRTSSSTGEIVNHMSIDATRLMELVPYLHLLWSGPLQIIGSISLPFLLFSLFISFQYIFLIIVLFILNIFYLFL